MDEGKAASGTLRQLVGLVQSAQHAAKGKIEVTPATRTAHEHALNTLRTQYGLLAPVGGNETQWKMDVRVQLRKLFLERRLPLPDEDLLQLLQLTAGDALTRYRDYDWSLLGALLGPDINVVTLRKDSVVSTSQLQLQFGPPPCQLITSTLALHTHWQAKGELHLSVLSALPASVTDSESAALVAPNLNMRVHPAGGLYYLAKLQMRAGGSSVANPRYDAVLKELEALVADLPKLKRDM